MTIQRRGFLAGCMAVLAAPLSLFRKRYGVTSGKIDDLLEATRDQYKRPQWYTVIFEYGKPVKIVLVDPEVEIAKAFDFPIPSGCRCFIAKRTLNGEVLEIEWVPTAETAKAIELEKAR